MRRDRRGESKVERDAKARRCELTDTHPLILTLRLDQTRQERFNALRATHFPSDRNYLAAHVTLFHHLPGEEMPKLVELLTDVAGLFRPPTVAIDSVFSLGRGVAFRLSSTDVLALRQTLANEWRSYLSPQDLNFGRLHVTVQNKVTPAAARDLLARLQADFVPDRFEAPGLDLWRYLGGPWRHAAAFDFRSS